MQVHHNYDIGIYHKKEWRSNFFSTMSHILFMLLIGGMIWIILQLSILLGSFS